MTVELLAMRHAKSDWSVGVRDFERPLNGRGERAAIQMAEWLLANEVVPDRVVSSSAVRARTTAQTVVEVCGVDHGAVEFDDDLYGASSQQWIELAKIQLPTTDRLLICGHNPGMDDLVATLSPTPPTLTPTRKLMTTAAIARFRFSDWSAVERGNGELVEITRPR